MKTVFSNLWSMKSALHQSAILIRLQSNLRIAAIGIPDQGVGKTTKIAMNSDLCSGAGNGKLVFGLLIGRPPQARAAS